MSFLDGALFSPIPSTAPAFASTSGHAMTYALESTAANRTFQFPSDRCVRVTSYGTDNFSILFGNSSDVVADTATSVPALGNTVELFKLSPSQSHVAIASSTDVVVRFALGRGGGG